MHFRSLQQRLIFLLLLPVALLLCGVGVAGFIHARANMLEQWRESALFSLERAAHSIDMRLEQPVEGVNLIIGLSESGTASLDTWESYLRRLPGVVKVDFELDQGLAGPGRSPMMRGAGGMGFHRAKIAQVTNPSFDTAFGQNTLAMIFELFDQAGAVKGRLSLSLRFDYLLEHIKVLDWWKSDVVLLLDEAGQILAQGAGVPGKRNRLGETGDPLELETLKALGRNSSGTVLGAGHPAKWVAGFYHLKRAPWTLVLFAPGEKVLFPIFNFLRHFALAGLVCIALVIILIRLVTGRLARSVREVAQAAGEVAKGNFQEVAPTPSRDEIGVLVKSFNAMVQGLREKEYIQDTFGRYVDPQVARQLMQSPEATRLGGRKRKVAIMMTDIRGFTPLCERLSPEETITIINQYLSQFIDVIRQHQGIIVDFLGDAILVFFDSLREPLEAAVKRAACCALDLRRATVAFNEKARQEGLPELETGIGLNAGEVVVGNIGSSKRTKYGIVGGPVNATHRIQALAEGGDIVVSEAFFRLLPDNFKAARTFTAKLKGIEEEATLYLLAGEKSCASVEVEGLSM